MVTREPIATSPSMSTCAQILQSQPICASGRITQNCQTLVPDPMLAPFVCAEGGICVFRAVSAATVVSVSGVLKLNAFLPGVSCCVHSRRDRSPTRDVCQPQN